VLLFFVVQQSQHGAAKSGWGLEHGQGGAFNDKLNMFVCSRIPVGISIIILVY
jgi:hypothetical protein